MNVVATYEREAVFRGLSAEAEYSRYGMARSVVPSAYGLPGIQAVYNAPAMVGQSSGACRNATVYVRRTLFALFVASG